MERDNRSFCPIVKKLIEKREVWTTDDFERWIFAHPLYAVPYIVDVIRTAGTHHPPELAANFQTAYAWQLTQYPWEKVRQPLELLLHSDVVQGIAPDAMKILLGIIRADHPNAKGFLSHPRVLAKIPAEVDITDWSCAGSEHLSHTCLKGARPAHCAPAGKVWQQLTGEGRDSDD
ncbi:MAG TPA: hypothetical protein VL133_12270 [Devosia sp.]|nr:hypothetical protein [Devosia sp.]